MRTSPPAPLQAAAIGAAALLAFAPSGVAAQAPVPAELQIRLAVQAAPAEFRDGATVQGYDADGRFVTLREGDNGMVCMGPNPSAPAFEVSCHHDTLEPYFERGRELSAQGITGNERTQARWDEFTAGELPIPYGAIAYILTGEGYHESGEIRAPFLRWVIYTPNATPETTGITGRPAAPGAPWLMFPGTPGSHIMIVPPQGG